MRSAPRFHVALSAAALAAAALLFALRPFVPTLPGAGLDPAWVATLGEAADRGAAWGRDVAFTYGPASPLVTHYLGASYYAVTVPVDLALAAAFGAAAALLLSGPRRGGRSTAPAALALALVVCAVGDLPDGFLLVFPFAALLASLRPGRAAAAASACAACAFGPAALSKTSYLIAALPVFAIGDALALSRRRVPPLSLPFLLGAAAGAALYGGLSDPLRAAALQGEVVAGYAAAMGLPGPPLGLALFAAASAALGALAFRGTPGRREAAAVVLGLAIACFLLFKAGFVRDDGHAAIAWRGLALSAALLAAAGRLAPRAAAAAVLAALAAVYGYVPTLAPPAGGGRALRRVLAADAALFADGRDQADAAFQLARDPAGAVAEARAAKAQAWADLASAAPLGPLPGSVDALPSEGPRIMAGGLDYRPRPSFAEYSTYTEGLAAANLAFLEGPRAPRWFLFGPEPGLDALTIDRRFPNLAEGALWPALLSLYRPDHRVGPLLALERRAEPAPLPLGPPRTADVPLGAEAAVDGDGPVWAAVDLRLSPLGRLAAALWRPPAVELAAVFADGARRRFRFVPALGRAGFLLSPLVENASDFARLAAGRAAGPARRLVGVQFAPSPWAARFYAPTVRVTLRSVDTRALEGEPPASEGSAWRRLAAASPPATLEGGGRVAATAPSTLAIPAEGLGRAALAYGVDDDAWRREGSAGACFALRVAGGGDGALWSACLDPARVPADRGPRRVEVALPPGATELELDTACRGSCDAARSYWGDPDAAGR